MPGIVLTLEVQIGFLMARGGRVCEEIPQPPRGRWQTWGTLIPHFIAKY